MSFVFISAVSLTSCVEKSSHSQLEGQTAPDFTLPLVSDSHSQVTLSEWTKNQPVLLNFWATWCPVCVEEMPDLNDLAEKYKDQGLKVLAVNIQESSGEVKTFMKRNVLNFPVVLDAEGEVAEKYGIVALPVSILVAKGGKIIYYGFSLPNRINDLLKEGVNA